MARHEIFGTGQSITSRFAALPESEAIPLGTWGRREYGGVSREWVVSLDDSLVEAPAANILAHTSDNGGTYSDLFAPSSTTLVGVGGVPGATMSAPGGGGTLLAAFLSSEVEASTTVRALLTITRLPHAWVMLPAYCDFTFGVRSDGTVGNTNGFEIGFSVANGGDAVIIIPGDGDLFAWADNETKTVLYLAQGTSHSLYLNGVLALSASGVGSFGNRSFMYWDMDTDAAGTPMRVNSWLIETQS